MAETPAPPEAAAAAAVAPSSMSAQVERSTLSVRDLLEAGVHFGHQTRRWNPRMKRFLFGERNGVHIVDLDQTLPRLQKALDFLRETVASGGKVLFVSTKRQAQAFVEAEAQRCEQFFVSRRWLGGMLTNFKTVRKSIEHFKELLELVGDAEKVAEISKKELSGINRSIEKYKKSLDGIKEMTRLPDAVFIIDVGREIIAVKEANRLGIPIVAIVDSNCDPESIDFVVPGNDDSTRAIQLYCQRVADACAEGARIFNERVQSEVSEQERSRAAGEVERVTTGRVVVEIKQQPRRGRGTHSAAPRERERERGGEAEREGTEGPSAPVPASE
jgi:small subunit ribosomal protein S2